MPRRSTTKSFALGATASGSAFLAVLAFAGASGAGPAAPSRAELEQKYTTVIRPFMQTYCVSCHGKEKPQAQLDLTSYGNMASVLKDYPHWFLLQEKLAAKQMPPPNVGKQPSAAQRDAVVSWIHAVRNYEANRNAGDPGPVLARRLSNSEYDYTIRDLTGQDLRPTKEFPVDPANQEGFDNSGESLTLSPALMKKYVQAAKDISDHLVMTTTGLEFASHPVLAETDRDKFCILRIVDFYKKQPTDFADYFYAAWRYRHRAELGIPQATLQTVAAETKVSARYLDLVWKTLNTPGVTVGPVAKLQAMWKELPTPDKTNPDVVRPNCVAIRDWVTGLRKKVAWKFANLRVPGGFSDGGQCFVLWKDRQYASHRRMFYPNGLQIGGVPASHTTNRNNKQTTVTDAKDPDLYLPEDEAARAPYTASFNQFCNVFPDAFYIAERGRMFVDDPGDKGRLLTAGLHNSMGYFRDDTPLMEMILDEKGQQTLDHLWLDFNTVAAVPERMHLEFFVYERAEASTITDPEFNFARAEDKNATSDALIKKLADLYIAKAKRNGGQPPALEAIEEHFKWVSTTIRATERARLAAEPVQLKALIEFAGRAYRRPLTEAERTSLLNFYNTLRKKEGLGHEDAMRDCVVSVLMSPNFLFRVDLEAVPGATKRASAESQSGSHLSNVSLHTILAPPATGGVQPLPDYALASRLSYFLWSSMPDKELLDHAAAGDLHKPEVLTAQAHRMLKDARVKALAVEFGGNWLDFRRFEEHQAVDRERFPSFTDDMRESMYQEPLHFMMDEFQNNRSVLDMLFGKYTFVNAILAKHYGMNDVKVSGTDWVRVDNADKYGRGGILPMGIFLTKNASSLRTSPVRRGYWVVRRVLGEYIPPPPAVVPELPKDETKMGDRTLRQVLASHRENPACGGCHSRFDSYGLVFEGYGPVGELRTKDMGGKAVDPRAPFPGNTEYTGLDGLRDFVRAKRQKDFLDTFSRKLLSYAIGRTLQPSDDPTLEQIEQRLAATGYKFDTLVDTIVTSRQFRYRRALGTPDAKTVASIAR